MSEVPVLPSGAVAPNSDAQMDMGEPGDEEEEQGSDQFVGVVDYDDDWMMDEELQDNPYFDCRRCHIWRPSSTRWAPYNVCTYCHFNVAEGDPSRLRWCMVRGHAAPEASFFEDSQDVGVCGPCRRGV
jgi:hypothetical protein